MNHVIHHEIDYEASPDAIYQIFTGPGKFSQMTGGAPAEIDPNRRRNFVVRRYGRRNQHRMPAWRTTGPGMAPGKLGTLRLLNRPLRAKSP